jgi:high-affinity iron transporter
MWNEAVGSDAAELGAGPGSYDITKSVWHVNVSPPQSWLTRLQLTNGKFGNPELNGGGGWGIFNAILGWQNSATYGSVISYNIYWIAVISGFLTMRYKEVKGHWPLLKAKKHPVIEDQQLKASISSSSQLGASGLFEKKDGENVMERVRPIDEIS